MGNKVLSLKVNPALIPLGFLTVGLSQTLWIASRYTEPSISRVLLQNALGMFLAGVVIVFSVTGLLLLDLRRAVHVVREANERGAKGLFLVTTSPRQPGELGPLPRTFSVWSSALGQLAGLLRDHGRLTVEILDHLTAGVVVMAPDSRILTANHSFCRMFNLEVEKIRNKPLPEVLPAAIKEQWSPRSLFAANWYGDEDAEVRDPDSGRLYRTKLIRITTGDHLKKVFALVVEDMEENAEVKAGTEGFRLLYAPVLEGFPEAALLIGDGAVVLEANTLAADLLGYSLAEVRGLPLGQLLGATSEVSLYRELDQYFFSERWHVRGSRVETRFKRKNGTEFEAEVRLGEWKHSNAHLFLIRLRDVSEENRANLLGREGTEVYELMAACHPWESVLARLTHMVEHQIPGAVCVVMLRRDDRLHAAAVPGVPPELRQSLDGVAMNSSEAPCSVAASEARFVAIPDIAAHPMRPESRGAALELKLRACWSAPILSSQGLAAGAISVYLKDPGEPGSAQVRVIETACRMASLCLEQREFGRDLAFRARHDALTGLPNREQFEDRLKLAIAGAKRHGRPLGIVSVDLDNFRHVNDGQGFEVGDRVLQQMAARLRLMLRETDVVARWGGDELRVGVMELQNRQDAIGVADRLLARLNTPVEIDGMRVLARASAGISFYPDDGQDAVALLRHADAALHSAKEQRGNGWQADQPSRVL